MKNILLPLFIFGLIIGFPNMAHADRIYLYKDINDKNWSSSRRLSIHNIPAKVNDGVFVNFVLPCQIKDEKDFKFNINAGIPPSSKIATEFKMELDKIRIRVVEKNYPISRQESTVRRYGDKISTSNGEIVGKEAIAFNISNTFGASFGVKIDSPIPEKLYLDYKLRIKSELGEEDVVEGTITMEKTSYREKPKNPFFR